MWQNRSSELDDLQEIHVSTSQIHGIFVCFTKMSSKKSVMKPVLFGCQAEQFASYIIWHHRQGNVEIGKLPLSQVLLCDDARFEGWLILVPRKRELKVPSQHYVTSLSLLTIAAISLSLPVHLSP